MAKLRTVDLLPEIFQTPVNEQFLAATLDQLVQEPQFKQTQGYVGQRVGPGVNPNDYYVTEPTATRTNYQLEPGVVSVDPTQINKIVDAITYPGINDALAVQGGFVDNANSLYKSEYYTFDPFVSFDSLVNYNQYYWLPNGPDPVTVAPTDIPTTGDFTITRTAEGYTVNGYKGLNPTIMLARDGIYNFYVTQNDTETVTYLVGNNGTTSYLIDYEANPTLTLTRGNTYVFNLSLSGSYPFYIKNIASQGTVNVYNNGVTNNGATSGLITFTVPYNAPDTLYYCSSNEFNLQGQLNIVEPDAGTGPGFWIQTNPSVNGTIPTAPNISARSVLGVINNGTDLGTVEFDVPISTAQSFYYSLTVDPSIPNVSLISNIPYANINNVSVADFFVSYPTGIDGITDLNNRTVIFLDQTTPDTKGIIFNIRYVNGIITINSIQNTPVNQKVDIQFGTQYSNTHWYVAGNGEFTQIPLLTAVLDTLYYQDGINPDFYGAIQLVDVDLGAVININDIIGSKNYVSPNGVVFSNGMLVTFQGNVNPSSYSGNSYFVEGVGSSIVLLPVGNFVTPEPYTQALGIPYDTTPFDVGNFDGSVNTPLTPDYVTINRASPDLNAWSRSNRWFHIQVINASATYNNTVADVSKVQRAVRPILEFRAGTKLFNFGTQGVQAVDIIDFTQTNALLNVNGQTTYSVPGQNFTVEAGTRIIFANDEDLDVRDQVYVVTYIVPDTVPPLIAEPVIYLVPDGNGKVLKDQTTVCLYGETLKGVSFWYDGLNWICAQQNAINGQTLLPQKTSVNQPPLFDVYDQNGYSFGDQAVYPSSTFIGSKLFSYALGSGLPDTVLGFPLSYLNINNIGDIVFENSLYDDTFIYVQNSNTNTVKVSDGFVYQYSNRIDYIKELGWQTAVMPSTDRQQFQFVYDGTPLQLDVAVSTETTVPAIQVFVGGKFQNSSNYTVTIGTDTTTINLTTQYISGDVIEVVVISDQISQAGFYQVPMNLENNPLNGNSASFSLGTLRDHYNTIGQNMYGWVGPINGSNNSRDLGNIIPYGLQILQQSSPLTLAGYFLRSSEYDIFQSIDYSSREYIKFKSQLMNTVANNEFDFWPVANILDWCINYITAGRTNMNPFYWSDMLPHGGGYTESVTVVNYITTQTFNLNATYTYTSANYLGLSVYLTTNPNTSLELTTLLIHGVDYVVSSEGPTLTINDKLEVGDIVTIREYSNTAGSFVPNTPSKMGLYNKYIPSIYVDTKYINPTTVIQGHDGSITVAFGDIRDEVLLEFEKRIYNNIKTHGNPVPLTIDEVKPGFFRTTNYTNQQIQDILNEDFLSWVGWNKLDFKTQNYISGNPFTYNYSDCGAKLSSSDQVSNLIETTVPGAWRGIYEYFYDTIAPNTRPWEMLGFSVMPSWWKVRYGPAPYTSGNLLLWQDLESGYVADPVAPYTNPLYARPGLTNVIPVGSEGELLSPLQSVIGLYDSISFEQSWKAGDGSPVEYTWWTSSSYPFAVMRLLALTRPAQFFSLFADRDLYKYNIDIGQYLYDGRYRLDANGIQVYGNGNSKASYINWIVDYNQQLGWNSTDQLTADLQNLDVRLCYRMASFTEQMSLGITLERSSPNSTNSSLTLPPESYQLMLYKNTPFNEISYSAVIIEIVQGGYAVYGYDNISPYFNIFVSNSAGTMTTVSAGGATVTVPSMYTKDVVQIPYGYVFTNTAIVVDFILSYGKYLEAQGMTFTQIENGYTLDWNQMAQQFLYFSQQGWQTNTLINLNPAATTFTVTQPGAVADTIASITPENMLLDQNRNVITTNNLIIERLNNNLSITTTVGQNISFLRLRFTSYEDIIVFNNVSIFSDLMYDPITAARQNRVSLSAFTSTQWDGQLNAQGFILNSNDVPKWQPNVKYTKGQIVLYKNNYWQAADIVQPASTFNYANWYKSNYAQIDQGLLQNLATKANQLANSYNVNSASLNPDQDLLSYNLIGFNPRQYMSDINLNNVSQVNIYRWFIETKGTLRAAELFNGANLGKETGQFDIYENWMILLSTYGANANRSFIEIQLNEADLVANPSTLQIINPSQYSVADQTVYFNNLWAASTVVTSPSILPTTTSKFENVALPSAGYVDINDVDITVFSLDDPTTIDKNINLVGIGTYIWVAKTNDYDWNVYRCEKVPGQVTKVSDNLNSTSVVYFTAAHGLKFGDITIIRYFNNTIDGVYRVLSVPSPNTIIISFTFKNTNQTSVTGTGLAFTLQSARVAQPSDVLNLSYSSLLTPGAKVWVDDNGNGEWEVLEKVEPFTSQGILPYSVEETDLRFGYSLSQTHGQYASFSNALVGAPGYNNGVGALYSFDTDFNGDYKVNNIVGLSTIGLENFGCSVNFGNQNWVVVGADESNGGVGYAAVLYLPPNGNQYQPVQLLLPKSTSRLFGCSTIMSTDERWIYVGASESNEVYAYGRVDANPQAVTYQGDGTTTKFGYSDHILIDYTKPGQLKVTVDSNPAIYERDYTLTESDVVFNTAPDVNATVDIARTMVIDLDHNGYFNIPAEGGSGVDATFTIDNVRGVYNVGLTNGGQYYEIGDILTIYGTEIGGQSPANDVTIIVTSVSDVGHSIVEFTYTGEGIGDVPFFVLSDFLYTATNEYSFSVFVNDVLQRYGYEYTFIPETAILSFPPQSNPPIGADIRVTAGPYFHYCATIPAPVTPHTMDFGFEVNTTGDGRQVVIGAPADITDANPNLQAGAVYVFDRSVIGIVIIDNTQNTYTIEGSVSAPLSVLLNGQVLTDTSLSPNGQYTILNNQVILSENIMATLNVGSLLEIETNQFQLLDELYLSNPIDEARFGYAISVSSAGDEVYIGAPYDGTLLVQAGSVQRFINQSKEFGVTTSTNANPTLTVGSTIRINDILVAVPQPPTIEELVSQINSSNIPNAQAIYLPDWTGIGDGITTQFNIGTLYSSADAYNTVVYVNGVLQNYGTNYTYSNSTNTLTFVQAPSVNAIIVAKSGRLTISVINAEAATEFTNVITGISEVTVLPGISGTAFYDLGFDIYVPAQTFYSPSPLAYARFGSSVNLNTTTINLVVGAENGNAFEPVTFDAGTTTVDEKSTTFSDTVANSGVVYTYNYLPSLNPSATNPGNFVFGQQIYNTNLTSNDKFGHSIDYTSGRLLIGAIGTTVTMPTATYTDNGAVYVYYNKQNLAPWAVIHQQEPVADTTLINSVYCYDAITTSTQTFLDYINPLQGKILGVAQQNIDYIGSVDPASYNTGVVHNFGSSWGDEHVGQIWWDTDSVRFINPNQNDINYASRQWAGVFPGSSVNIYQWVQSTVPPTAYNGPGIPLSTTSFTVKASLSDQNVLSTYYYFWVRGLTTTATGAGKTLSCAAISSYIQSPISSGIPYIAALDASTIAIYNTTSYINAQNTILHVEYDQTPNTDCIHTEYQIISDGDSESFLNPILYQKLQDSFCGVNVVGALVPDPTLPVAERYGVQYRPRQSMFVNRFTALQNYLQYVNTILLQNPIAEYRTFPLLNSVPPVPEQFGNPVSLNLLSLKSTGNYVLVTFDNQPSILFNAGDTIVVSGVSNLAFNGSFVVQSCTENSLIYLTSIPRATVTNSGVLTGTALNWNIQVATIDELYYQDVTQLPIGTRCLVQTDSNYNGFWTVYELYSQTEAGWVLVYVQPYNTPQYWYYVNWYASGYNSSAAIVATVPTYAALPSLSLTAVPVGSTVKVLENAQGNYELYVRTNTGWDLVCIENGTIQFSETLWDYGVGSFGFDDAPFDAQLFDEDPTIETRFIIQSINEEILVGDLAIYRNQALILMFEYIYTEFSAPNWLSKTSLVDIDHRIRALVEYPIYQPDNQNFLIDYFNEVKPYHVVVRNFNLVYNGEDIYGGQITDFDCPAYYDVTLENPQFVSPVLLPYDHAETPWQPEANISDTPANAAIWSQSPWSEWFKVYDNGLLEIIYVKLYKTGSGYATPPDVIVTGNCSVPAQLACTINPNGTVASVEIINPGSGYTTTPQISFINGASLPNQQIVPAQAYPLMGNQQVRSIRTHLKYDRCQYSSSVTEWQSEINYPNGSLVRHLDLKTSGQPAVWRANGPSGSVQQTVFDPAEWVIVPIKQLNCADRTMGYYVPSANETGLNLSLLIDGISYPGVQVMGLPYTGSYADGYAEVTYDIGLIDGFPGTYDYSTSDTFPPLDAIYKSSYTDTYLGQLPHSVNVSGGAYVDAFSSHAPPELVPGIEFDTLDFRVYTRPGSNWTAQSFENLPYIEGYNQTGFNASGTVNNVPGSYNYSGTYNHPPIGGHGYPQNLIKKVYEGPSESISFDGLIEYPVVVTVSNQTRGIDLSENVEYTVNWITKTVHITNGPSIGDIVVVTAYGLGNGYQVYQGAFNGADIGNSIIIDVNINEIFEFVIFLNGHQTIYYTYTSVDPSGFPVEITFDSTLTSSDYVTIFAFAPTNIQNGLTIDYSWCSPQTQVIQGISGQSTYVLQNSMLYTNSVNAVVTANGLRLRTPACAEYSGDGLTTKFYLPNRLGFNQSQINLTDILVYVDDLLQIQNINYRVTTTDPKGYAIIMNYRPQLYQQVLVVVTTNSQCIIDNNQINFINGSGYTPVTGDIINVTSWNDTRQEDLATLVYVGPLTEQVGVTQGFDSTPFDSGEISFEPGSFDYSEVAPVSVNALYINQPMSDPSRLWVSLNGKHLFYGSGYSLNGTEVVLASGILQPTDIVMITEMTDTVVPAAMAFRIFQDMRGMQVVYRITPQTTTTLLQDLLPDHDIIYVKDVYSLTPPQLNVNIWGVLTINGERIMYRHWDPTHNTVSGLLRGTAGTAATVHYAGAEVYNMNSGNALPVQYQNYIVSDKFMGDGVSTSFYANDIYLSYIEVANNPPEVEVYVGGILQTTKQYTIPKNEYDPVHVIFNVPPPSGVMVNILVRRSQTWYNQGPGTASDGVPLQLTDTLAAMFLRGD